MTTRPYRYQRDCANEVEQFGGRALNAMEPGLGKSITSLLWAKRNPEARPIVIVCPASIKWNWQRECSMHFGMLAEVLDGNKPPETAMVGHHPIVILNYDILGAWLPFLRDLKPQLVILDEAHYLGNSRTQRTKNTRRLCKGVPHVLALSGTPLTNRPAELWPTLNILRPDLFPSFASFAQEYCRPRLKPWGWVYDGATNLPRLHQLLLETCMVRRLKSEVLTELPPKRLLVVPVEMERPQEYQHAHRDLIGWLATRSATKANRARRAEQLVKVGYLKRLASQLKLPSVCEWTDNFLAESAEKLVLFAVHKEIIGHLEQRYRGQCVVVDGSVVGKDRQRAVDQFQQRSKTRLFIGNIKAAGVGLNLTAARTVAFAELAWTPGAHTQGSDRLHRIGQRDQVDVFYLVARGSIEERLCEILQTKQGVLSATLDGVDNSDELNVFDQLVKELERGGAS